MPRLPYNPGVRELVQVKRAWSPASAKDSIERGFLGWHENGYLPHRDQPGLIQFITFRLADALPAELRSAWEGLLKIEQAPQKGGRGAVRGFGTLTKGCACRTG